jgi:hypothetical protein
MHSILLTNSPILVTYASYAPIRMNNKGLLTSCPLPMSNSRYFIVLRQLECVRSNVFVLRISERYLFNPPIARIVHLSSSAPRLVLYPTEGNVTAECTR